MVEFDSFNLDFKIYSFKAIIILRSSKFQSLIVVSTGRMVSKTVTTFEKVEITSPYWCKLTDDWAILNINILQTMARHNVKDNEAMCKLLSKNYSILFEILAMTKELRDTVKLI